MNVESILRTKGRNVVTIRPDATIASAAALLHEKKIGAVVIADEAGRVEGILSERDIVRTLAESGATIFDRAVSATMTRHVHSCGLQDTINDLMARMTSERIRHLPVLDKGKLCGIVSIGDVVKYRLEEVEFEAGQLREYVGTAG